MKTRIFNLIILDESGSMYRVQRQAVDGVNETLQTIRSAQKENADQEHFVTLVTFNTKVKVLCSCVPALELRDIADKDYNPDECTALYDAMGMSLTELKHKVAEDDRVLVTIVTDGLENASSEYDCRTIKKMVEDLKKKGWVFAYIGANQNVEEVGESIAISNTCCFEASEKGTRDVLDEERFRRRELYDRMTDVCFNSEEENISFFASIKKKK